MTRSFNGSAEMGETDDRAQTSGVKQWELVVTACR
jgi:hypothetical protein